MTEIKSCLWQHYGMTIPARDQSQTSNIAEIGSLHIKCCIKVLQFVVCSLVSYELHHFNLESLNDFPQTFNFSYQT